MKNKYILVLAACFSLGGNAFAEDGYALAQKHMCTSCHSLDKKIMGPPWRSIAIMYQDRPDAEAYLIGVIRNGGSGTWGDAKMPASVTVGDADIKAIARYILALPKE